MSEATLVDHLHPISDMKKLHDLSDEDGNVTFRVAVELGNIVGNDLEGFNDLISETLSEKWGHGLNDISYTVVGCIPRKDDGICTGQVLIEVVSSFDWDVLE